MVELATGDASGVLLLQEVPVWALSRLEAWSAMQAHLARRAPAPASCGRGAWLTRRNNGRFRSRLAGQANAFSSIALSLARISGAPGRASRVGSAGSCMRFGSRVRGGRKHAPHAAVGTVPRAAAELDRARAFLETVARPGEPRIVAGDLNLARSACPATTATARDRPRPRRRPPQGPLLSGRGAAHAECRVLR